MDSASTAARKAAAEPHRVKAQLVPQNVEEGCIGRRLNRMRSPIDRDLEESILRAAHRQRASVLPHQGDVSRNVMVSESSARDVILPPLEKSANLVTGVCPRVRNALIRARQFVAGEAYPPGKTDARCHHAQAVEAHKLADGVLDPDVRQGHEINRET